MSAETEYITLDEDIRSVQKKLNQWRHSYELNVISFTPYRHPQNVNVTYAAVLLSRVSKLNGDEDPTFGT